MVNKNSSENLRRLNKTAFFIHLIQAILVLILSVDFSLPITGSFLELNPNTQSLELSTVTLFYIQLPYLIAGFFFLSALFHLVVSTKSFDAYIAGLKRGVNKYRWIEYSLSASVMIVAIGLLVGIYDFTNLLMMFGLIAVMNLLGWVMEVHNQKISKTNWLSFNIGVLAGALPWIVIAHYLLLGAFNGSSAPTFVYIIFVSIFVFFSIFALNMYLQYKKVGKWKDYIYGERAYIFLSLSAKSALAWQVFAGALQP